MSGTLEELRAGTRKAVTMYVTEKAVWSAEKAGSLRYTYIRRRLQCEGEKGEKATGGRGGHSIDGLKRKKMVKTKGSQIRSNSGLGSFLIRKMLT